MEPGRRIKIVDTIDRRQCRERRWKRRRKLRTSRGKEKIIEIMERRRINGEKGGTITKIPNFTFS